MKEKEKNKNKTGKVKRLKRFKFTEILLIT